MIFSIYSLPHLLNVTYEFELLDRGGKKIGFWYSLLSARTFLRFEEDGTVLLPTPDLDTYEKLEPEKEKD